ncbi:hypothetical protein RB653_010529 [Dictyostelium firmibasis]|uniref:Uncharacterized protein n=1 Tax=Dictyostelium firmibasis TaxID=79012 RepID=A0AAN7YTQ3_9MYCE
MDFDNQKRTKVIWPVEIGNELFEYYEKFRASGNYANQREVVEALSQIEKFKTYNQDQIFSKVKNMSSRSTKQNYSNNTPIKESDMSKKVTIETENGFLTPDKRNEIDRKRRQDSPILTTQPQILKKRQFKLTDEDSEQNGIKVTRNEYYYQDDEDDDFNGDYDDLEFINTSTTSKNNNNNNMNEEEELIAIKEKNKYLTEQLFILRERNKYLNDQLFIEKECIKNRDVIISKLKIENQSHAKKNQLFDELGTLDSARVISSNSIISKRDDQGNLVYFFPILSQNGTQSLKIVSPNTTTGSVSIPIPITQSQNSSSTSTSTQNSTIPTTSTPNSISSSSASHSSSSSSLTSITTPPSSPISTATTNTNTTLTSNLSSNNITSLGGSTPVCNDFFKIIVDETENDKIRTQIFLLKRINDYSPPIICKYGKKIAVQMKHIPPPPTQIPTFSESSLKDL